MKNLFLVTFLLIALNTNAQNEIHRFGITIDGHFQQYNGNLGNSFFKYKSTCFGGFTSTLGVYLNKSFDLNVGGSIGHFGYCQTNMDANRMVSLEQRCPGCTDRLGMGELRSLLISGNLGLKFKLANDIILRQASKVAPYLYTGVAINNLSDNMKRNCVNVGTHYTVNGGAGIKYNFNHQFFIGYNIGIGCFVTKKVYATNETINTETDLDPTDLKLEKRKDLILQNGFLFGFNF
jgi:hypothetical protein